MSMYRLLPVVAVLAAASPASAALTVGEAAAPLVAAAIPREAAEPDVAAPPVPAAHAGVSDGVLVGMAVAGLLIVGIAARRRQSGRSVTS